MSDEKKLFGKPEQATPQRKPATIRRSQMPVGFMLLKDAIRKLDSVVFKELDE
jgi:hypothetical protein